MFRHTSNTFILLGAVLGIVYGFILRTLPSSSSTFTTSIYFLDIAGDIFVNLLKMVLIPIVFLSIVVGIAQLRHSNAIGRVWPLTLAYYTASMIVAVALGLLFANVFQPGKGLSLDLFVEHTKTFDLQAITSVDYLKSFLDSLFVNPVQAAANNSIFPIVIFAFFIGIAFASDKNKHHQSLDLFNEFLSLIKIILGWIMTIAPIGVMALLAQLIALQDTHLLGVLSKYIFVVTGATLTHGLIILPLVLWALTGISPSKFFWGMKDSFITALSTSSSSATMPITIKCLNDNFKVSKSVTEFVVPLGTTVNMDGTALYEAMAALFVANLCGIELSFGHQLIVAISAMIASVGAPGIPSAGMVTMAMVLQSVGLPIEALAILIPIDRPLDTIRTVVNVEGDAVATCIVDKYAKTN